MVWPGPSITATPRLEMRELRVTDSALLGKYFVKIFQKLEIFLPRIGVGVTMMMLVL